MAIDNILLQRGTRDGKYDDLIDVAELLGDGDFGTAPNAIAVMIRESPTFQRGLAKLRSGKAELAEVPT